MVGESASPALLALVVALALAFSLLNGVNDSAGLVATVISSRALAPRQALLLVAAAELIGPFLFGTAVATAIGRGIVEPSAISPDVILIALGIAIGWNLLTLRLGMPSSSSHALIGGLVGAVLASGNYQVLNLEGLLKIVAALLISPLIAMFGGYLALLLVLFFCRPASPRINALFKRTQVVTSVLLALSHGTNDGQKTMGVITMALLAQGAITSFTVPPWVTAVTAASLSIGVAIGGWRIIRTLGGKIYRIRPVDGFTIQSWAATVILGASLLGGPVSTAHVVSSCVMGVGAAERVSKVRWGVAGRIVVTWLTTIPATMALAAALRVALSLGSR